jgi:hypothetical protein
MKAYFREDLDRGFSHAVRYNLGEAPNAWGSVIQHLAGQLDKAEKSEEVTALLHELFEEIGQQARDATSAIYQAGLRK